jgi:predicted PurR-regulated permease PerM
MIFGRGSATFDRLLPIVLLMLLAIGCFVVLRPFLTAVLWAAILAYSTWPTYTELRNILHSRSWAAAVMTLLVATVIIVPVVLVGSKLVENSAPVIASIRGLFTQGSSGPPSWIARIPIFGPEIAAFLTQHAIEGSTVSGYLRELLGPAQSLILGTARTIAAGVLELALSVLISFFFFRDGDFIARRLHGTVDRVGGTRAVQLLAVAGATIKGVVYGVLGTALAQAILAGIGFFFFQVPGALFLAFLTFLMSLLPMGPPLVWIPAVIWLVVHDRIASAIFLAIWGFLVISGIDNLLKPYLISRAGRLPFILVLLGALGGVLAFGLIGIFLGPILLAMGFNLVLEWSGRAAVEESRRIREVARSSEQSD